MNTVFVVKVTWTDGCDSSSWVESIWSTQEKAEQVIIAYKEQDDSAGMCDQIYEVIEWEVDDDVLETNPFRQY